MSSHEVASGVHTAQADQILAAAEPPRERYVPPVVADTKEGDTGQLVEFLQDRDTPCPLCGYNLRNLTDNVCPECRHELRLTVGVTKPMFLWFLLAMTPCSFAGIAAGLTLIPVIVQWLGGGRSSAGDPRYPRTSGLGERCRRAHAHSPPVRVPSTGAPAAAPVGGRRLDDPRAGLAGVVRDLPHPGGWAMTDCDWRGGFTRGRRREHVRAGEAGGEHPQ